MKIQTYAFFLISVFILSCKNDQKGNEAVVDPALDPKQGKALAVNLMGDKLLDWQDPDSVKNLRMFNIEESRRIYLGKLDDPKGYLLYGRAFLANGQVENAIQIFSKGTAKFPEVPDLYLYNGEAMLLGRQLQPAIDQFWKAGQNMEKLTAPAGISGLSYRDSLAGISLQFKNYLLMGLAFQCNRDLSSADKMFEVCGDFSTNPDLWIRSYYWQYECYNRSGRQKEAQSLLGNISKTMQILPVSQSYLDAMLYYKGEISEKDLVDLTKLPTSSHEAEDWLVRAYAVGVKNLLQDKNEEAIRVFKTIISTGYWNQLPYLATEGELARLGGVEIKEPEVIELNTQDKKRPVKF